MLMSPLHALGETQTTAPHGTEVRLGFTSVQNKAGYIWGHWGKMCTTEAIRTPLHLQVPLLGQGTISRWVQQDSMTWASAKGYYLSQQSHTAPWTARRNQSSPAPHAGGRCRRGIKALTTGVTGRKLSCIFELFLAMPINTVCSFHKEILHLLLTVVVIFCTYFMASAGLWVLPSDLSQRTNTC